MKTADTTDTNEPTAAELLKHRIRSAMVRQAMMQAAAESAFHRQQENEIRARDAEHDGREDDQKYYDAIADAEETLRYACMGGYDAYRTLEATANAELQGLVLAGKA